MRTKHCDKCGETVSETKAFCPQCGNAFVEEERRSITTNFEEMDMTVQLGQTMYNQMLSDMGLNVSKAPNVGQDVEQKVVEVAAAPIQTPVAPVNVVPPEQLPTRSKRAMWIIIGVLAAIVLLGLVIVIAAAVVIFYLLPNV